ncbi:MULTISPECIES: DNA recombination protein RmuC [unclassified Gilliamella]|uniref:DNA recombination protein RmuC n=1 Tax=unclassified Gilliamella TaxID=2685620 RepID=UPI00226A483D|nr:MULTISPECIES: DNA recombination protein RmuC [unclassified Gilliamella]MCX8600605.1 DNA recombination protein RmuC [Gilliamella sp. B3722]MCX8609145.1 DNA recombination protein RmuC [Gilliamella sp. B3771]MCX8609822.1 DNA recombination protein RmuC [Gilliamella sp. B3891]MCX8612088.1 DNA recombination protein RmuC [Gilliamella sp. B3773]MCX8615592.1 DNA recombination protein RmuC [Gilliamella sp. B3770]
MLETLSSIDWILITISAVALILLILVIKLKLSLNNLDQIFELQFTQKNQENQTLLLQVKQLDAQLNQYREQHIAQNIKISELKTRLEETLSSAHEKQILLEQSEQRLTTQFENLANRIFESSGKKIEQQNKQSLDFLLSPLKEQLEGFKKQVQDSFGQEAKERHTLTHEIRNLQQLNEQMTKEATNLTNALKGNNKTQGNWGEFILSQILDNSGLRMGYEYETQVNLTNENKQRLQPDVIVHLPQGGDVVIDSKVTLVAYERFFNSDDEVARAKAMSEHLTAVRNHLKQLSQKDYHKLIGINSLDYILMFIPVEPAFLSAIDNDPALINDALKNNIMIVSPTTLLVALRTIHNLWRYEYQNRNAELIADKASKLYDKMRGFIEDMEGLGNCLDKAQQTYQSSMNKLAKGRGNVIGQIERFRELGIEVKKPINPDIALLSIDELEQENEN